ncbi:MAG: hypothetical protein MZV65_49045, partial [Chromatiales bacterium]|nr:hypothetical protein [Chromatiales bacterium]
RRSSFSTGRQPMKPVAPVSEIIHVVLTPGLRWYDLIIRLPALKIFPGQGRVRLWERLADCR